MSWDNLKPPVAPIDGWSTVTPPVNTQASSASDTWGSSVDLNNAWETQKPIDTGWGIHPDQTSPMTVGCEDFYNGGDTFDIAQDHIDDLREAVWTANALDSAVVKTGVVNSLNGTKDHFNIDQDGELTRMKEIATGAKPEGYYIAYHNGRWLHAVLAGPYRDNNEAESKASIVYDMMIKDVAFQLAFENKFDRGGIYVAQIPLAAKRKGAYGVIA